MTEKQLQPHLERLKRIWKPIAPFTVNVWEGYLTENGPLRDYDNTWELFGRLKNNWVVRMVSTKTVPSLTSSC